ncbi:MAG: PAS domain S-box protein [Ignavibacteriales bacterium]|nr:PAS domain S-box protein [Ignavibacteriales bacterium]MBK7978767.1 PAS domain S-box protein [Ignavibacteriota bacterium]
MTNEITFKPSIAFDQKNILDNLRECIVAFTKNYELIYFNNSFKERFELFIGEKLDEKRNLNTYRGILRFSEFYTEWNYWIDRCLNNEKFTEIIEYKLSGKKLHFQIQFLPVIREDEVEYIQLIISDETVRFQYEDLIKKNVKEFEIEREEIFDENRSVEEERDQALNLLIENVERLQIVFEGSNDGFWDWNIEKDEIFYSKHYYEILGYRNGGIKSDLFSWQSRIHPEDMEIVVEALHSHLEGNTPQFYQEYRVLTKTNEWKWVLDKGKVAIRDMNNNPLRVAGTLSDISERKKAEEILKESEARFLNIAKTMPLMLWMTDERFSVTYFNPKTKDFIGEENFNKNLKNFIHKDDISKFNEKYKRLVKYNERFESEIRIKNKEGEFRWILVQVVPRLLQNGDFVGLLGVGNDITKRKEAEKKLLESETQFNEITSVVAEGLFLIDKNKILKFANPEFYKLLGYSCDELKDTKVFERIYEHANKLESEDPIEKVFNGEGTIRVIHDYFKTSKDELLPVSFVSSPIKRNGVINGCVTAFHDITERIEAEDALKRYVEELHFNKELLEENAVEAARLNEMLWESETRLKELNVSKDKFFSIISHDLRSPLTSIIGFAEVMLEDLETLSKEDLKEFTNSIFKSSKNLQNLLENLLQWSKIQTGRIEFNPINFELMHLINDVIALYQVNAARKKISLQNTVEKNYTVNADKFMIETVLRNLVSNAIKFTPQGGVIKIKVDEENDDNLIIIVEDDGVGIKEDVIEKLFRIDSHITTKGTDKEKGTGLGLILCKEFIEKHNGTIWVESEIEKGSEFKFTLPYKKD